MKADREVSRKDSQTWESLRNGDMKAYEDIFKSHYPFLINYGLKLNNDLEEIKDSVQTLFSNLWERHANLGPCNSIRSYLAASVRRLVLKKLEEKSKHLRVEIDPEEVKFHVELSAETKMIHDQSLKSRIDILQRSIEKLPERQKEALYLKFYGEQSFADIAHAMDISNRAVYKLIYKALDNLGEQMNGESGSTNFLISIFF